MRRPVNSPYRITGVFGQTGGAYGSIPHTGVDYVSDDKKIIAPHSGRIIAGRDDANGLYVVIDNGEFKSTLSHLSRRLVQSGTVSEGTQVAIMGSTGKSTATHLHWTLRDNGNRVNPENYIKEEDMYKGKSAKEWYKRAVALDSYRDSWRKTANTLKQQVKKLKDTLKNDSNEITELRKRNQELAKQVDSLKGDAGKFTVLGQLLRELLGLNKWNS